MSMGGKGPEVLVTLTKDIGKILAGLHETKPKGSSHLATGISIAAVRGPKLRPVFFVLLRHRLYLSRNDFVLSSPLNIAKTTPNGNESSSSPAPPSTRTQKTLSSWPRK